MNPIARLACCVALAPLAGTALQGCDRRPRIEARPQRITFAPPPSPAIDQTSAAVSATASSGLPVRYGTISPDCSVDDSSGLVTATASGICTIAANQPGDARWAAAPQVTQDVNFVFGGTLVFGPAPALEVYDRATVSAAEPFGLPVAYQSTTPSICAVDVTSGVVVALSAGDCSIIASAGGAQATQTVTVATPGAVTAPGAPSGVTAWVGDAPNTVMVDVGALRAGGSPIARYDVSSSPSGLAATGSTLPMAVSCPAPCDGYRFAVAATSAAGTSPPSDPAAVVTRYRVVATFREPDTQPNDSVFVGTFLLDASAGAVSALRGKLSESMTGGPTPYPDDTMTWVPLLHQLSAVPVALGGATGWLVATFRLGTTDTLARDPRYGGTNGWAPGSGMGLYFGFPGANPGNAYVLIFVNAADPTAAPSQAQLDALAYADCTPGGMMGASCMTGTSVAGYGAVGTMGGYPLSQTTAKDSR
jgi:hypothetical protein